MCVRNEARIRRKTMTEKHESLVSLLYKCRVCGKFETLEPHKPISYLEVAGLLVGCYGSLENLMSNKVVKVSVPPCFVHQCEHGDVGILDFVGFRRKED
jgi:hypothetical protein